MKVIDLKELITGQKSLIYCLPDDKVVFLNETDFYDYYNITEATINSGYLILHLEEDLDYELKKLFKVDKFKAVENKDCIVFTRGDSKRVTLKIDGYYITGQVTYEKKELFDLLKSLLDIYVSSISLRKYIEDDEIIRKQVELGESIGKALDELLTKREQYILIHQDTYNQK